MRALVPLLLLPLLACPAAKEPAEEDSGAAGDTGYGPNPIVPDEYALLWDIDAEGCDGGSGIVYFMFDGTIDANGRLTGEERWYWFFAAEGWEGDCMDVFTVDLEEGGLDWETPCGYTCDREFLGTWTIDDAQRTCGIAYENFFDDDETDRIDEEQYIVDVQLDILTPSGNVNEDMLVFSFVQDDQSEYQYNSRQDARGAYTPDDGVSYTEGPATVQWTIQSGICLGG